MIENGKIRGKVTIQNKLKVAPTDLARIDKRNIRSLYKGVSLSGNNAVALGKELFKAVIKTYKKEEDNNITEISLLGGCLRINKKIVILPFAEELGNFITLEELRKEAPNLKLLMLNKLALKTLLLDKDTDGNPLDAVFSKTKVQDIILQLDKVYKFNCADTNEVKKNTWENILESLKRELREENAVRVYCAKEWGYDLSSQLQDLRINEINNNANVNINTRVENKNSEMLVKYYRGLHKDLGSLKDKSEYYSLLALDNITKAIINRKANKEAEKEEMQQLLGKSSNREKRKNKNKNKTKNKQDNNEREKDKEKEKEKDKENIQQETDKQETK